MGRGRDGVALMPSDLDDELRRSPDMRSDDPDSWRPPVYPGDDAGSDTGSGDAGGDDDPNRSPDMRNDDPDTWSPGPTYPGDEEADLPEDDGRAPIATPGGSSGSDDGSGDGTREDSAGDSGGDTPFGGSSGPAPTPGSSSSPAPGSSDSTDDSSSDFSDVIRAQQEGGQVTAGGSTYETPEQTPAPTPTRDEEESRRRRRRQVRDSDIQQRVTVAGEEWLILSSGEQVLASEVDVTHETVSPDEIDATLEAPEESSGRETVTDWDPDDQPQTVVESAAEGAIDAGQGAVETGQQAAEGAVDTGRDAVDAAAETGQQAVDAAADAGQDAVDAGQEAADQAVRDATDGAVGVSDDFTSTEDSGGVANTVQSGVDAAQSEADERLRDATGGELGVSDDWTSTEDTRSESELYIEGVYEGEQSTIGETPEKVTQNPWEQDSPTDTGPAPTNDWSTPTTEPAEPGSGPSGQGVEAEDEGAARAEREFLSNNQGLTEDDVRVSRGEDDQFLVHYAGERSREAALEELRNEVDMDVDRGDVVYRNGQWQTSDSFQDRVRGRARSEYAEAAEADLEDQIAEQRAEQLAGSADDWSADLERGRDFTISVSDGEFSASLTDSFMDRERRNLAEAQLEREHGVDLADRDFTMGAGGSVSLSASGREKVSAAETEQFGDWAVGYGDTTVEESLQGASEAYSSTVEDVTSSPLAPTGGAIAAGLYAMGREDAAATVSGAGADFAQGAAEMGNVASLGLGVKEAGETVGAGAQATVEGEGAEFGTDLASAGVEAGAAGVEYARENPLETAGLAAGSLAGGTGLMRAGAAVGPRAGLATRAAVQPGEEALGYGGAAVTRRVAGQGAADRLFPNNEPLLFSEEAAISAGSRAWDYGTDVASRTSVRSRPGLGLGGFEIEVEPRDTTTIRGEDLESDNMSGPGRTPSQIERERQRRESERRREQAEAVEAAREYSAPSGPGGDYTATRGPTPDDYQSPSVSWRGLDTELSPRESQLAAQYERQKPDQDLREQAEQRPDQGLTLGFRGSETSVAPTRLEGDSGVASADADLTGLGTSPVEMTAVDADATAETGWESELTTEARLEAETGTETTPGEYRYEPGRAETEFRLGFESRGEGGSEIESEREPDREPGFSGPEVGARGSGGASAQAEDQRSVGWLGETFAGFAGVETGDVSQAELEAQGDVAFGEYTAESWEQSEEFGETLSMFGLDGEESGWV